jgi:centrosomal protein CEP112
MSKVEADLFKSKQLREKQVKEYERQISELKTQHEKKLSEARAGFERDKLQLVQQLQLLRDDAVVGYQKESETLRQQLQGQLADAECQSKEREERDAKVFPSSDHSVFCPVENWFDEVFFFRFSAGYCRLGTASALVARRFGAG